MVKLPNRNASGASQHPGLRSADGSHDSPGAATVWLPVAVGERVAQRWRDVRRAW